MWVCIEKDGHELIVHGLFCCNDCAIAFAEEKEIREASFHKVHDGSCAMGEDCVDDDFITVTTVQ